MLSVTCWSFKAHWRILTSDKVGYQQELDFKLTLNFKKSLGAILFIASEDNDGIAQPPMLPHRLPELHQLLPVICQLVRGGREEYI